MAVKACEIIIIGNNLVQAQDNNAIEMTFKCKALIWLDGLRW
jgi:hypothetical protein